MRVGTLTEPTFRAFVTLHEHGGYIIGLGKQPNRAFAEGLAIRRKGHLPRAA